MEMCTVDEAVRIEEIYKAYCEALDYIRELESENKMLRENLEHALQELDYFI